MEFCFTNGVFTAGRRLQIEATLTAEEALALVEGVTILLTARGKDSQGRVHLSELVEIQRPGL